MALLCVHLSFERLDGGLGVYLGVEFLRDVVAGLGLVDYRVPRKPEVLEGVLGLEMEVCLEVPELDVVVLTTCGQGELRGDVGHFGSLIFESQFLQSRGLPLWKKGGSLAGSAGSG